MRKLIASLIITGTLALGACLPMHAAAHNIAPHSHKLNGPHAYWNWYELTQGNDHIDTIKIKAACISAEDSAAHLHLIGYSNGTAIYGCAHIGY